MHNITRAMNKNVSATLSYQRLQKKNRPEASTGQETEPSFTSPFDGNILKERLYNPLQSVNILHEYGRY